ncbi:hypothetical protein WR25_02916 isoform A [Diploscapter pachys]|uniref:RCR-type E3 ubiquitin transferase n=2 Tax=Diploscapter pachys TaxID=2018661 RepID=A0A2A2JG77_9BILA|nr:hypothetical protein WR25_02916 isoform A [Diploscapter pachys]
MELVLPESIVQISVGTEHVMFRSGAGHVWVAGMEERRRVSRLRKLNSINRRKIVSVFCGAGSYCYVTESGKVYFGGRHSMRVHPETGMILGLDGIHTVSVALGKTHAVAISKHGHVYTWGLNNLNQCGRVESTSAATSPRKERKSSTVICPLAEHIWTKDVPTICSQCGLCSARGAICSKSPRAKGSLCSCGQGETSCLRCGICRTCGETWVYQVEQPSLAFQGGSGLHPTPTRTYLSPSRVLLQKGAERDVKIASLSCGNFHTVMLSADGKVFTMGSNCHGQLGVGDLKGRSEPQLVVLDTESQVVQVAAGNNHTVIRTTDGTVYTFGAHSKGQLARGPFDEPGWNATPGKVAGFGPGSNSFASWIGAEGDTTLIHSHTVLLSQEELIDSQIVATRSDLFVFPRYVGKDYFVIRRKHHTFTHHQLGSAGLYTSWHLEPRFDILWSFNAAEMRIQALSIYTSDNSAQVGNDPLDSLSFLRSPEFAVPNDSPAYCSSIQLAASVLSSTFAAITMSASRCWLDAKMSLQTPAVDCEQPDGYCVVNRYDSPGGSWGYSMASVEAIQFMVNRDIKLLGIGLYGGRGEYMAKLKFFRLQHPDCDETYLEPVRETDEMLYDCAPRETGTLLLTQPINIKANVWHVISAKISGPSSDCGASGKNIVDCDDVVFSFRNSSLSNNGTDISVGQIPEIYYQLDSNQGLLQSVEEVKTDDISLSHLFSPFLPESVSATVFSSLLDVFNWTTRVVFDTTFADGGDAKIWGRERTALISLIIMRLLSRYTLMIYKVEQDSTEPNEDYARVVCQLHQMLMQLFANSSEMFMDDNDSQQSVLQEALTLFVSLSHCFLCSKQLISAHLVLAISQPPPASGIDILSAAVVGALSVKENLIQIFLHNTALDNFPNLARHLLEYFKQDPEAVQTLTSFQNFLRFLYEKTFLPSSNSRFDASEVASDIIVSISKELATPNLDENLGPAVTFNVNRFRRRSSLASWEMTDGAVDAVAFRVDIDGVLLHGVAVYISPSERRTWTVEVLQLNTEITEKWETVGTGKSDVGAESADAGIIKLDQQLSLIAGVTYCVKVQTTEPTKTYSGEGGYNHIRLSNGARLTFCGTSMSQNGTTVNRGQIPYFIYSIRTKAPNDNQLEEKVLDSFLLLLRLFANKVGICLSGNNVPENARAMFSRICAHVFVFMERFPDKAIEVMATLEQLIPIISSVNGMIRGVTEVESTESRSASRNNDELCESVATTITAESLHPYKPNSVYSLVVGFEQTVDFMCLQFSPDCQTSQFDDQLIIYLGIERHSYLPIARYYGNEWPTSPILLPGNSLWFVLESSSPVEGVGEDQIYGFNVTITGYPSSCSNSILRMEQELVWLSASASRLLVQLPSDPRKITHLSIDEEDTRILLEKHGSLLKKGLNLAHVPTLNEIIAKGHPSSAQTPDLVFLREFISTCPTTTAGFLAKWLPIGPVVDPSKCQLSVSSTDLVAGRPVKMSIECRDQFDRPANIPSMIVQVTVSLGSPALQFTRQLTTTNFPTLKQIEQNSYQPTILNRARYMSISAMPAYSNYSHEEIRLGYLRDVVVKDAVQLKQVNKSCYAGYWTPSCSGNYRIECKVDGFELSHTYTLQVRDRDRDEDETTKQSKEIQKAAQLSKARNSVIPKTSDFRSIRMRLGPSLVAPCVGTIPRGAPLSYIEEVENDDGKWLRLTDETAALFGYNSCGEQFWCLSYHRHLNRVLIPLDDLQVDTFQEPFLPTTEYRNLALESNETYVIDEGESVQIYGQPSPSGCIVDEVLQGRREIRSCGWVTNQYGVWIQITGPDPRYILAENATGHSSIHSLSFSTNGNEDEENSPPPRQPSSSNCQTALRPSVVDCCRVVFASFLWHENLVRDAMAAGAYLKFHQNLHGAWLSIDFGTSSAPAALQPLVKLWKEICNAVLLSIEQHLIMPPALIGKQLLGKKESVPGACELCEEPYRVPIIVHMRMAHPGCGEDSQGYGYNSGGRFTTGWSGKCGSGGRVGTTWYLLCPTCRSKYLKRTPWGHREERTRRWREFRLSTTALNARPEEIIKQNALFLLDLNSTLDGDSKNSSATNSGWTINLFPTTGSTPSTMPRYNRLGNANKLDGSHFARSSFMSQSISKVAISSDPGPKMPALISPPSQSIGPTSSLTAPPHRHQSITEGDAHETLQSPSTALRSLINTSIGSSSSILKRPVMAFVVEHHNLQRIKAACEQAIRRAIGFSHAFRVWNWLLRLVSSETSVSDVIFQYLTALSSYKQLDLYYQKEIRDSTILPHPWRLCFLAGPLAAKMVGQLHAFLYTTAVILQSSGVDFRLRSLCFRAWTIQLTAHEQELLILTCNILGTVGGVLSDGGSIDEISRNHRKEENVDVKEMKDVTSCLRIEASSRQAMVVCLTDGNMETFWESGEEDKNRARSLTLSMSNPYGEQTTPALLCIFIDNVRDDAYRTTAISIRTILPDGTRKDLMATGLEQSFCGWIKCCIASVSHITVLFKGAGNAVRVRQLMALGFSPRSPSTEPSLRPSTSHQLFFSNTQRDAFGLFQAISSQAFCGELSEDGTLRERVIDLLFNRVQLQPLQNYVCTQVVQALERYEEVVQRQCLDTLFFIMGVFSPSSLDVAKFLKNLLIVVAKVIQLQVRDKAAHSVFTAHLNTSLHDDSGWRTDKLIDPEIGKATAQFIAKMCDGTYSEAWSLAIRQELANSLLGFAQSSSLSSSSISSASKDMIISSVLGSKRFWLSVSALALMKDKSWLELSERWQALQNDDEQEPGTICENHDDGRTLAQIYCTVCEMALCRECFTIMHLHKKNRNHQINHLGSTNRNSDVDIHQGCARMRVGNLLILFHGETLNGLVEISKDVALFPSESRASSSAMQTSFHQSCRFCGNNLETHKQILEGVCTHDECVKLAETACEKRLPCGHYCSGIKDEINCPPCLFCGNQENRQDCDDVCVICFTDRLGAAPCIQLECGHLFHYNCLKTVLTNRWNGPRIQFRFMNCPLCNRQMNHVGLSDLLEPLLALQQEVINKARMRLEYDGLLSNPALTDEASEYYGRLEDYAMDRYMYVLCFKCNKAYFGGESRCQVALDSSQYNPEELICGGCSDPSGVQICSRHGVEYLEYKCRFCCSIAVYFCFGTTHFCAACHDDFQQLICLPKNQLPKCPAGPRRVQLEDGPCPRKIEHPPAGEEFAMGCGICRNICTF